MTLYGSNAGKLPLAKVDELAAQRLICGRLDYFNFFVDLIAGHFRRFDRLSDTGRGHVVAHVLNKVGHRATV